MHKQLSAFALMALLSGCVVGEPAPYYGGYAPYYATTVAPAYVGVYGGGYYPYYGYTHIHGGYNNGYWHAQNGGAHWGGHPGGPPPHSPGAAPHGGPGNQH